MGIIDDGICYEHPDLQRNIDRDIGYNVREALRLEKGEDQTMRVSNFINESEPGHGTMMAGVIGAVSDNGEGIASVTQNVKMIDFNFAHQGARLPERFSLAVHEAIRKKIPILNCSFRLAYGSHVAEEAIKAAREAGIILVTSAGNATAGKNKDHDLCYHYPSSYKYGLATHPNPTYDNIVIVAASCKETDEMPWFSFYGPETVDIVAPGQDIWTTIIPQGDSEQYGCYKGTSLAAAHVTGALALLKAHFFPDNDQYYEQKLYRNLIQKLFDSTDTITELEPLIIEGRRLNLAKSFKAKVVNFNEKLKEKQSYESHSSIRKLSDDMEGSEKDEPKEKKV